MQSTYTHLLIFLIPILGACSDGDDGPNGKVVPTSCEEDTRDETYFSGISKTGESGYTLTLLDSDSAPPAKGDNVWTIELKDATDTLLPGMTITAKSFMPDHGHFSPLLPVVTDEGSGVYTLDPVNLFMPGYWETTLSAVDPAGDGPDDDVVLDSVMFKFCVDG